MLNDLLWKLLGKVGIQKEGTIVVGNRTPTQPMSAPVTEDYKVPQVTPTVAPQYTPQPSTPTTSQYQNSGRLGQRAPENAIKPISQASSKFGVPMELLLDIAFSESSYNPQTKNEIGATGLYQFTPETWQDVLGYARNPKMSLYGALPTEDPTDPLTNALAAAYLIKMGQLGKWDASEWNWGQKYTPQELEGLGFYDQSLYHKSGVRPSVRLGK